MSTCTGVGGRSHAFFLHEGHDVCSECQVIVCRSCQVMIDKHVFCLRCYTTRAIDPLPQNRAMTIADMRLELKSKYNFDGANELDMIDMEDVFLSIGYIDKYRQHEHSVPFPIYPTSDLELQVDRRWDHVIEMDFKAKVAFLAHPDLTAMHIPGILQLFGSMVAIKTPKKTQCSKVMSLHDILPASMFMYAANCRVDSGYRLLQRCIRHATDSRFPMIDKEIAMLINHNGELRIQLSAVVPASMKNCSYMSEIVLTPTKNLCCKCTCPCGSQNKERTLCVHNLPLLYYLTLLLFRELAGHIIREFAACMRSGLWQDSVWSAEDMMVMKRNIILLSEAAGKHVNKHNVRTVSIDELLDIFLVGTEKRREWKKTTTAPPKPCQLGPIKNMVFPSTRKQGTEQTKLQHSAATKEEQFLSPQPPPVTTEPGLDINLTAQPPTVSPAVVATLAVNVEAKTFQPNYLLISLLIDASECYSV
jgi:hypothetical protein